MTKNLLYHLTFFFIVTLSLQLNAQNWTQTGSTEYGPDYYSKYGYAVASNNDGTRIIVSAPNASTSGGLHPGRYVDILQWNASTNDWDTEATINYQSVGESSSKDGFGYDLDMNDDGDRVIILSSQHKKVYVFSRSTGGVWSHDNNTITISTNNYYSKASISGDGNYIAIRDDTDAKVYYYNGSSWVQRGSDITVLGGNYDIDLNYDGSRLAVGIKYESYRYYLRVYSWNSSSYSQLGSDIVNYVDKSDFGRSIQLNSSGNRMIVGAPNDYSAQGKAYVYQYVSSWSQIYTFNETDNYKLGISVSISNDGNRVAAVSTGSQSSENGHIYVYENTSGSTWTKVGQQLSFSGYYEPSSIDLSGDGEQMVLGCPGYGPASPYYVGLMQTFGPLEYPGIQATNITFSNVQSNSMTLNWSRGDGQYNIVWMKVGSSGSLTLSQNAPYTANSTFSAGTYNSGWYCVYSGTESSVTVTNLQPNTAYQCQVFEYNGNIGVYKLYLNSTATGNPAPQTTESSTPTLTTTSVSSITPTTASSGGNVSSDGGLSVTARGVVWNTTELPTVDNYDGITSDGTGTGSFTSSLTNLLGNTTYYVRAFATNSDGTAYGTQRSFSTTDYTEIIWDGSEDSDWNTADNWDLSTVPNSNHNITIPQVPAPASNPVIGSTETADCNDLTIESGGSLTINSGGTLITNGTITSNGTVNIKQSLTEDGHWHFISVPNNATTGNTFLDMYLQEWIEGDGEDKGWQDIVDPEPSLTPVKGYSLWVPGDAKMDFTYTGTPNTGDQSIAITANGSGTNKWMNFVGNPYPSYLDWDEVNGYGSKYTWNGTLYLTYTQTGGYGLGDRYVAPMEGFFIYKDVGVSDNFSLTNAMRSHQPVGKKDGEAILQNVLVLTASNGNYEDELWLVFKQQASESFELQRDAWKLLSGTHGISQLWSVCPDGNLSIDVRPETETIQLGFTNNEAGTYSIGIKEIADISTAILEDTKLNVFYDLNDGEYTFDWSLNDNETRFKLHFNTTAIEETDINTLKVFVSGGMINISSNTPAERIILSNITGQILSIYEGSESIPAPKTAGVYLVSIENDGQRITQKIIVN